MYTSIYRMGEVLIKSGDQERREEGMKEGMKGGREKTADWTWGRPPNHYSYNIYVYIDIDNWLFGALYDAEEGSRNTKRHTLAVCDEECGMNWSREEKREVSKSRCTWPGCW